MTAIEYPRQTVLVTARAITEVMGKEVEKDNVVSVSWHTPVSVEPQLYAVAIGKERFTTELIQKSRNFAVNFMTMDDAEKLVYCGTTSGEHIDKFKGAGLTMVDASTIDCPVIKEAAAYMECEVAQEVEAGDHIIFIGRVTYQVELKRDKRPFQIDDNKFTTTVD